MKELPSELVAKHAAVGEDIRELRVRKRLSQRGLSQVTNLHQGTVSEAETGKDVQLSTLVRLADGLDADIRVVPRTRVHRHPLEVGPVKINYLPPTPFERSAEVFLRNKHTV